MKQILLFAASIIVLALGACSQESFWDESNGNVKTIRVVGPEDITFEEGATRGTEIINGSTLRFSWVQGDSLGIFPDKGNQVEFPITSTEGGTSAVFDGGGWALRNRSNYAAYYPFSVWNYHRNNKTILLDYSGQVQDGNGSFAHLSAYDYLASSRVAPENGEVCFEMSRLGSILYIDIVVPEPTVVHSLVISCDEAVFTEKADLDISGEEAASTPKKMTKNLTLEFKNTVTSEANETVRGYLAVYPVDFSNKTVYAFLNTDAGRFGAAVVSKEVKKGKATFLRFLDNFEPQYGEDNGHKYVEMAPGFYWATCNIGADNPWNYGDYFAWGETEPKTDYSWATYKHMYPDMTNWKGINKYQVPDDLTSAMWYDGDTFIGDGKVSFADYHYEDDAAYKNWGSSWRTPTDDEWTILRDTNKFQWTWITDYEGTGISGYVVSSLVPNYVGNQVFLPAAGLYSGSNLSGIGSRGFYWSSSLVVDYSVYACSVDFYFFEDMYSVYRGTYERFYGRSIRPVYDPTIIPVPSIPEPIDLGLPSGLKWASFNIGATKPEEYGDYFAWGETEPKSIYNWSTYIWCLGEKNMLTKYCQDAAYGFEGFTDEKTVLDPEDDVAHVKLGGKWRMPTIEEWIELTNIDNCTWEQATQDGVNGWLVTGPNGNSIFFPAAGEMVGATLYTPDSSCYYWSSSLTTTRYPYEAYRICKGSDSAVYRFGDRFFGYSVRPVCDE